MKKIIFLALSFNYRRVLLLVYLNKKKVYRTNKDEYQSPRPGNTQTVFRREQLNNLYLKKGLTLHTIFILLIANIILKYSQSMLRDLMQNYLFLQNLLTASNLSAITQYCHLQYTCYQSSCKALLLAFDYSH